MRTFYYEFADGYKCFTSGRLTGTEKTMYRHEHGAILVEKMV